jgi:hypothetical protein
MPLKNGVHASKTRGHTSKRQEYNTTWLLKQDMPLKTEGHASKKITCL